MRRSEFRVGLPEARTGADLVEECYKRNLRIFANILNELADGSEVATDRIVVMFGAGHTWTLRQFFRDHPDFQVVPVAAVLDGG
ncbi:MAG: DUF5694 domain-containing protein [bacterium]